MLLRATTLEFVPLKGFSKEAINAFEGRILREWGYITPGGAFPLVRQPALVLLDPNDGKDGRRCTLKLMTEAQPRDRLREWGQPAKILFEGDGVLRHHTPDGEPVYQFKLEGEPDWMFQLTCNAIGG
jgi:hypothetical protein